MEFDEILISYVQERAYLYDKKNSKYKNERMKENAWTSIGEGLNSDGKLVGEYDA